MSTTRSDGVKIICVEPRQAFTDTGHYTWWTCAIKRLGAIHWFHGDTPLRAMKCAVRACHEAREHEAAVEVARALTTDAVQSYRK